MKQKLLILFFLAGFVSPLTAFSQTADTISMEETLAYISGKLGAKCSLAVVKGSLIVKFYDTEGLFREDKVDLRDIDETAIRYAEDEKAVILPCNKGQEECVDRRLIRDKKRKFYSRLNFIWEGDKKSGNGLAKAFIHMTRLVKDSKYTSSTPFE
jgi:hypothetical protein